MGDNAIDRLSQSYHSMVYNKRKGDVEYLPYSFYEFMFDSEEPFYDNNGRILTVIYNILSILISIFVIFKCKEKLLRSKNVQINTQGFSIYTYRIYKLCILSMYIGFIVSLCSLILLYGSIYFGAELDDDHKGGKNTLWHF